MKLAFSTVACPDWTLEQVASFGSSSEYDGVELRTFGHGSATLACDPALTAPAKVLALMSQAGLAGACLATGCRFDEPIFPPVIGRVISDTERSVREAKSAIQLAAAMDVPYVRVFGFEFRKGDDPASAERRIIERLSMVVDAARNTGVKVLLENGGSFPRAEDIAKLIAAVNHPLLGAAYSPAAARAGGDDPIRGMETLADRLWSVKLKDVRDGRPCPIGEGEIDCRRVVQHLSSRGYTGWITVEWDRLWVPELGNAEAALGRAAELVRSWSSTTRGGYRVGVAWA